MVKGHAEIEVAAEAAGTITPKLRPTKATKVSQRTTVFEIIFLPPPLIRVAVARPPHFFPDCGCRHNRHRCESLLSGIPRCSEPRLHTTSASKTYRFRQSFAIHFQNKNLHRKESKRS